MISVVMQCRDEIREALSTHWSKESFSLDSEIIEGKMLAGVVHSIPTAPMINWNEQAQTSLMLYLQQTKDFIQKLVKRTQRPSVCIVVSSSAVYGSQEVVIEEGHPVASNVWADWIVQYESLFSSLDQVGIRVVYVRCGIITFSANIPSAYLYNGKKDDWVSWVSVRDLCRFVDHCLRKNNVKGMFHLVHPNWVQKESCIKKKRMRAFSLIRTFIQGESVFSPSQKVGSRKVKEIEFCFSDDNIVKSKN